MPSSFQHSQPQSNLAEVCFKNRNDIEDLFTIIARFQITLERNEINFLIQNWKIAAIIKLNL